MRRQKNSRIDRSVAVVLVLMVIAVNLFLTVQVMADKGTGEGDKDALASYSGKDILASYNGKKLGVISGTPLETAAKDNFPKSGLSYYKTYPDLGAALLSGHIEGFLADEPTMKMMRYENPALDYIPERLTENKYSFAFKKNDEKSAALCEELNAFIGECHSDGTLQELEDIWYGADEEKKTLAFDSSELTGEKGNITVVTTSTDAPWSYIKDGKNVGYDIDLIIRFCRKAGYSLKLMDADFDGRIPAVRSGKADFSTDMNVTPEREEEVLFSDPVSSGGIVLAVMKDDFLSSQPQYKTFGELSGKTISMLTGAPFEELISEHVSDVKEYTYFNNMPDMLLALKNGKTDAVLTNNAIADLAINRDPALALFPQSLKEQKFGFAFQKGSKDRNAWQRAYDGISEETKQAFWAKWTGADEAEKVVPEQDWPGTNGTVKAVVCDTLEPMSYAGEGGKLMGFDVEMLLLMAKELDVHVEFTGVEFAAVLSSVQSGKAQVGAGSIIATDERKEAVDFVEYYPAAFVLIVRNAQDADSSESADAGGAGADESSNKTDAGGGFLSGIKASFEKTFLRENRYQLFLSGIATTMLVTVLSVLLGTALGFLIFMLCRNGNPVANACAGFFTWLIQGMPVVVLLMILYYIIFAKAQISGTIVSVIAFTLVFGAGVFGMLKSGVGAVDRGQAEAALALGYSDLQAFFRIVLPQALPHFLPAYKGEIVALIKATAVVGYIAVQDLTKMGDIVRSRTYEAFFPLIAVAVIYFVLAGILTFIVGRLELVVNPKRRKRTDILKGVRTDDRA